MSEKKIEYLANRRNSKVNTKRKSKPIKKSNKVEQHHIVGKINSNYTIPLCKTCHDFISLEQNSLSVAERKNKLIMGLKSLSALFKLAIKYLELIIEKEIQNGKHRD